MKIFTKLRDIRFYIPCRAAVLSILPSSVALTLLAFILQPNTFGQVWECMARSHFQMLFLNLSPVFLFMLFLYLCTNNIALAHGSVWLVAIGLSYANRYMTELRQTPFFHYTIRMVGEFAGVSRSLDKRLFINLTVIMAGLCLLFAAALYCVKSVKIHPRVRWVGMLMLLAFILVYNKTVLGNKALYKELYMIGNRFSDVDNFNSKGFIYSFLYAMNTSRISQPTSYDKTLFESDKEFSPEYLDGMTQPHIIMIMSEAFSDILSSLQLDYTGFENPMKYYEAIREKSVSGYLVAPNMGGGTADTEFDVLTGLNTRHFRGVAYSYSHITTDIPALPNMLGKAGYDRIAIHPGDAWFYNRGEVYKHLGFQRFIDITGFDEKRQKGMYITEEATFDCIIDQFEQYIGSGRPLFEFCVTIQNHGPYIDKYGAQANFSTELDFSQDETNALANYIEGMIDCDRELNRLVEYLKGVDEPVILIYFGDHLPSFPLNILTSLIPWESEDTVMGNTRLNRVPFLIWENEAAKNTIGIQEKALQSLVTEDTIMSSGYLGATLLELLGYSGSGLDAFMDYTSMLRRSYPIILENQYFTAGGLLVEDTGDTDTKMSLYRMWEYQRVFE